ncbi:low-specificity L-threonine aldolase [Halospeciosus flavus]|uniref:Low-specificity L-threonine aldolase n=1 Tax=Halospeciosus flavus TaxID=3032283 RepID=A0ABD5Z758_9EURY|nr:low-specificity L-threonine aldolase [Halospeciosus flavus]
MIDLRSDTVTRPSDEMREAAAEAPVGDDVYGEDPSVNELEERAADLVGKEAALFVPSGTMGNQIAARVHTERGEEAIVEANSHVYKYELGGFAQHADLQIRPLDGGDAGIPSGEQVADALAAEDLHAAGTGLLSLENTHNRKGGVAIPPEEVAAAAEPAREFGVPVHLDGARVFNAAVALDVPVTDITSHVDSVMFCLSKGLGAPVGSMLAGSQAFVDRARRERKLFGGGLRQAGVLAGPGLRALDNVGRLAVDHQNAERLADGLDDVDGLSAADPDTNIVLVDVEGAGVTAAEFLDRCATVDVHGTEFGEYTVRFCTHLDVTESDVDTALDRIADLV